MVCRNQVYSLITVMLLLIHLRGVLVTGRNEVVAKVMFLLVSVILSTGGSASVHAGIPPPTKETPLPRRPPAKDTPPAKETPLPRRPPCQGDPPAKETPPGKQTQAYGTHPTGMHSCFPEIFTVLN